MALAQPHIILIILDTAGAKHMSLYGYERHTTPQLERLATQATLYTRCYAPAFWTLPSHASLFTGLYPSEHGVDSKQRVLSENFQHIASVLKYSGYRTYGISCNGIVSPVYGNCRDFDVFHDYSGMDWALMRIRTKDDQTHALFNQILSRPCNKVVKLHLLLEHIWRHRDFATLKAITQRSLSKLLTSGSIYRSAPYTKRSFQTALRDIKGHLDACPDRPFFQFINVIENHEFYNPPKSTRRFSRWTDKQTLQTENFYPADQAELCHELLPTYVNLYDDTMVFLDSLLGQFHDQLESLGVLENTVLVITSDHGEHFGEKGYFGHRLSLLSELLWVPLLIRFPVGMQAVGSNDRLVSLVDLFSTFLDLSNSPFPSPRSSYTLFGSETRAAVSAMSLDGMASKYYLAGRLNRPVEWTKFLTFHKYALILDNGLKLLEKEDGNVEIYNLIRDPAESLDLAPGLSKQIHQDLIDLLYEDQRVNGYRGGSIDYSQQATSIGAQDAMQQDIMLGF